MFNHHYLKVDVWSLRSAFAWTLLIIALLILPLSVLFFWLRFTIFDTNQFVKTISPISKNPAIVESLSANLSENFFQNIDAEGKVRISLPDSAKFLAPALTSELQNFITKEAGVVLTSDAFNNLWEKILREAHPKMIHVLTGRGDIKVNSQGEVVLDFSDAISKLQETLNQKGIYIFNNQKIEPQIALFKSEKVAYLSTTLSLISVLGIVFPVILVLLIIGAVLSSVKRLQFLVWTGLGLTLSSLVLLLLIQTGEGQFTGMAGEMNKEAAGALYQILTDSFKKLSIEIIILGLLITLGSIYLPKCRFLKGDLTR